ncbi:MAG: hypothetical protein K2X87_16860 [Gemmataceae bacterium]|nr:hypothetical protein [Gemmataceae bacterium]
MNRRTSAARLLLAAGAGVLLAGWAAGRLPRPDAPPADPARVFEQRILPIFKSPDPSSCVQCHLAGVDLKHYIRPSHEETFRSLRDQGLLDLDRPAKSKILTLIQMGADDKAGAELIPAKARKAEYEAFAAWIAASAADPKLRAAPKLPAADLAGPKRPVEVVRHARTDRLLASFEQTVWAMRFRCMGCHTEGTPENKKLVDEHGERVAWMKATPAATLAYLRASNLIDPDEPEKSLLLKKPLNAVKHGGGQKFLTGDQGYKAYRAFLEDYAKVVKDQYPDAKSLPKPDAGPLRFGTDIWVKLTDTPPAWADKYVRVDVYAWDAAKKAWEAEPVATTDRRVWGGGKLWQHNLTLQAPRGSDRAKAWQAGPPALPKGRYLLKVYVDRADRLAADWTATLGEADAAGSVEVESAWPSGYGRMTAADARRVTK